VNGMGEGCGGGWGRCVVGDGGGVGGGGVARGVGESSIASCRERLYS
jgi:hypothetical protein